MKDNNIELRRGPSRCFADGILHTLALTNLYSGAGSLGDRIMNRTMYRDGPVDRPLEFTAGMLTGIVSEISVPVYISYRSGIEWYKVLACDLAIKTIPRGIDFVVRKVRGNSYIPRGIEWAAMKALSVFGRKKQR